MLAFHVFEISIDHILKNDLVLSWITCGILGSPKIEMNGFGAQGHVQKSRNHVNYKFSVFPMMESKSY